MHVGRVMQGALRSAGVEQECPQLMTLNTTLHQLLSVWLAMGNLQLERITWQTSCDLLQKVPPVIITIVITIIRL